MSGVGFPAEPDGRRGTTATGRRVAAAALRAVDPVSATAVERETAWRSEYVRYFRRMVEAGLPSRDEWLAIAAAGLAEVRDALCLVDADGAESPLAGVVDAPAGQGLGTVEVVGDAEPRTEFVLPYRGQRLRGDEVRRRLDDWAARGIVEPSVVGQVEAVLAHPEWLRLDGHTVAVLGAGSEMGPLTALLRWGATVAAVDLPDAAVWQRVLGVAREGGGRVLAPVRPGVERTGDPAGCAGADLLADTVALADWLSALPGRVVIGNYTYADGGTHVLLSAAVDALSQRVLAGRGDVALAFLATPTDVFAVPHEVVEHSSRAYENRSRTGKIVGRPLRTVSRGRLLQRAYRPDADPGIADALSPVQGPNYALAKRIQRWRASTARAEGTTVSFHVAPSTRTRSVVKNRALAAAFAGAHRFGVEVFDPATANTLMAALLVHDLHRSASPAAQPWQEEVDGAVHGGIWRAPYAPRSALGLAALLGFAGARG